MNSDLLTELTKKDDDLEVLSYTPNEVVVSTTLLEGSEDEEAEPTLELVDVRVQVIRFMFMINCLLSCLILTGFIPYQILVNDASPPFLYGFLGTWLVILLTVYLLMAGFRRARLASMFLIFYFIAFYIVLVNIAAVLHDYAPLQFGFTMFTQSLGVIFYTIWNPQRIDAYKAFYLMCILGLVGWLIGIFAFVVQQDWIPALLLLIATLAMAAYSGLQIKYADRYSLSFKDAIESCIRFYADPVILLYTKIKNYIRE